MCQPLLGQQELSKPQNLRERSAGTLLNQQQYTETDSAQFILVLFESHKDNEKQIQVRQQFCLAFCFKGKLFLKSACVILITFVIKLLPSELSKKWSGLNSLPFGEKKKKKFYSFYWNILILLKEIFFLQNLFSQILHKDIFNILFEKNGFKFNFPKFFTLFQTIERILLESFLFECSHFHVAKWILVEQDSLQ